MLVLIRDDNLPAMEWKLGIQAVFPGADGMVQITDIKTASGTIRHTLSKLLIFSKGDPEEPPKLMVIDEVSSVGRTY